MSTPFLLVLFAVLQNIDNLVLAGAYRLRGVRIPLPANAVIAVLSGVATGGGVILAQVGRSGAAHFGEGSWPEAVGRGMLIMIGVWTVVGYFRERLFQAPPPSTPPGQTFGTNDRGQMSAAAAILPATALAVDNIAPSLAFGMMCAKEPDFAVTGCILVALTTAFSVVSVWAGQAAGRHGRDYLSWVSPEIASGCLMIGIATFDVGDFIHNWFKP